MTDRRKNLMRVGFVLAVSILPVYFPIIFLEEGNEFAKQNEVQGEVWLPKDCTVITDQDSWAVETKKAMFIYERLSFEEYQQKLADDPGHMVFLGKKEAFYLLRQGHIAVSARKNLSFPGNVDITELRYLGNGKVSWSIEMTSATKARSIFVGVLVGIGIDFIIFFALGCVGVFCFLIYEEIKWRRFLKQRLNW